MPVVGAAIATSFAAATSTAIGSFIINTVASMALSAVSQALRGKPRQAGIRTDVTLAGEETPGSLVFGKYATGGFMATAPMTRGTAGGMPNGFLTYVIELADMPIGGLDGIWIGDEKAEILPPVAGSLYPDHNALGGRFSGKAWFRFFNGRTTAYAGLTDHTDQPRPWQDDMIGRGLPFVVMRFRYDREVFQGLPQCLFEVTGIPLYDPRKDSTVGGSGAHRWGQLDTYEPSENPGVQVYNILRGIYFNGQHVWGGRASADDLPLANWFAAMNACDVLVDGQPRWRSSFEARIGPEHFGGDEPAAVIEEILRGCSGSLAEFGGTYRIRIGGVGMPVAAFTDEDIIISEGQSFEPFRGLDQVYNTVQAQYPEPVAKWASKEAPRRQNAGFVAEDGDQYVASLNLPATPYPAQVQRVMRAYMLDGRRQRQHNITLPPEFAAVEVLDAVAWTSPRNGYVNKVFEVTARDDNPRTLLQGFGLRERDPNDYNWTPDMALPSSAASPTTPEPAPRFVLDFAVQAVTDTGPDGVSRHAGIRMTWNPDQPDARALRYEIRQQGQAQMFGGSVHAIPEGQFSHFENIRGETAYEVRARLVTDRATTWTAWLPVTTGAAGLSWADWDAALKEQIEGELAKADAAAAAARAALDRADAAQAYADTIVDQARADFQVDFNTAISATQDALAASQAAQLAAGGANEDRLAAEAAAQAALAQADLTVQERIASQTARSSAEAARDQAVVARDEAGAAQAAAQTSQTIAAEAANRALTGNIDADAGLTGFPANYTLSGATARLTKVTPTVEGAAQDEALRFGTTNNNVLAAFATPASPVERAANRTYRMSVRTLGQTSPGNVSNGVNGRFEVHIEALLAGAVVETHRLALNAPVSLTTWGLVDVAQAIAAEHDAVRWRFDRPTGRSADNLLIADRIIRDVTESASAANSANAAATSAALAASSATDAGSNAVASEQSRLAAEAAQAGAQTARANAEVARDAAVTARQDAQGAASTATTQAGLAATARDQAGNSASAAATSASAAATSATQAGQQASAAESSRLSAETARGGAETARTDAESARDGATIARDAAVVARQDAEGASAAAQTSANLAATSRNEAAGFADAAGTARTQAQNSATAAANSATTAGTHATNAGSSATAANNARIAAEAARDGANSASASAGIARDQAVLARQNAETAAAGAQESLRLTAEVSGRDMSVINDTFLISSDWARIGGQGTLTTPANTVYPIGRDWRFVVTNSQNDGLRINQSPATIWPGQTNADAYVVEVEFTLVSGGLGGAGIQLSWTNSAGSNFWTWAALADIQAGVGVSGRTRTARVVLRRPANFSGTFASHTLTIHANAQEQNWVRQAKTITFHRIRIRPATAEELGSGQVEAGVRANILVEYLTSAQTQGAIAALEESMTAQMGGSLAAVRRSAAAIANMDGTVARFRQIASVNGEQVAAGIEAVAFDQNGGATGSLLKLIGDNVVAEGTLSANALVVGLGKNLIADAEFTEGSQHWTLGEWDAANHSMLVLPPGSFGAHPAYPTLAARQTGSSTANASLGFRPVANEGGGRAWGVPVVAGQRYCGSAYLRITGGGLSEGRMQIVWRDASGASVGNNSPSYVVVSSGDGSLPDTWTRVSVFGVAPAGAVFAELRAQKRPGTAFPNTLCIWKPQFEEVHASASQPSPWSPGGTTYISGDRLITGGVVSRHVTTETIRAINGRFSTLAAANISVGNAEIGNAQIANGAISNAKIGNAEVDTLKLAGNSVTIQWSANAYSLNINLAHNADVIVFTQISLQSSSNQFFQTAAFTLTVGGNTQDTANFIAPVNSLPAARQVNMRGFSLSAGQHTIQHSYSGSPTVSSPRITVFARYR